MKLELRFINKSSHKLGEEMHFKIESFLLKFAVSIEERCNLESAITFDQEIEWHTKASLLTILRQTTKYKSLFICVNALYYII